MTKNHSYFRNVGDNICTLHMTYCRNNIFLKDKLDIVDIVFYKLDKLYSQAHVLCFVGDIFFFGFLRPLRDHNPRELI
jgi:hypothetical protein